MKNFFSGICFCLFFAASVFSQTSTDPAPSTDAPVVDTAVPAVDTPQSGTVPDAPAGTADSVIPQAESPETVPQLPSGERLLYFYPEPDFLYVPPISPVTAAPKAAAKPATAASVPAPAPAPAGNQAAGQPASAPAKTAGSTADKAAEKAPAKNSSDSKKADTKTADTKSAGQEKNAEAAPGIWTAEPVAPATQAPAKAAAPVPSRKATLALGQTLEVWYPGSGWVYLGDVSAQNGLNYESRKLDKADTFFTFRSLRAGDYILEFSRYDVLSDSYSSDLIAVTVTDDGSRKAGKIRAPDYRSATLEVAAGSQVSPAQSTALREEPSLVASPQSAAAAQPAAAAQITAAAQLTSAQTNGLSAASSDGAALLAKAKASLSSGDAPGAIASLDAFFGVAVDSLDEGWFLRGQAYEANSAARDIRKALGAYQTLVSAFPESSRWNEADARIRYIKQYYLGR